ncbi:MAG: hypothetical protein CSA68_02775 [Rhodobacterales bacterium]|nr:MAG: hypothetical protein CR958_00255 [Rhodobacterales bacterium]PIE16409.1 MAG: hypothetical protein CSA68_02775 [Rhodobacterales bacterium]
MELNEDIRLNSERLVELYVQLGQAGAQDVVCRAMEELAVRFKQLAMDYNNQDYKAVRKCAKSMVGIAEQVGMQCLADVAQDVRRCAENYDTVALAATLARLLRIGDKSLTAIWDSQDLSV